MGQDSPLALATAAHKWSAGIPCSKDIYGWALVRKGRTEEGVDVLREAKAIAYDIPGQWLDLARSDLSILDGESSNDNVSRTKKRPRMPRAPCCLKPENA